MLINSTDSNFNIINQTLLFYVVNTPETEINFRFIETELIGLGCGKSFAFSRHPHNGILNNIIAESIAEDLLDASFLLVSDENSIFNYENILEKNLILKSKKNKPKTISCKMKKNKKASRKIESIMKLAKKMSSIPKEILDPVKSSPMKSIHQHEFIQRINSLSEKSFCVLEANRKNPLLILDLKKIRLILIDYFIECHRAYNTPNESGAFAQTNLLKHIKCLECIDRLNEEKNLKKREQGEEMLFTEEIDALEKKIVSIENEFSKNIVFEISDSIEILKDFIRIIINLDKLNRRNCSIQERLKVCLCTTLDFQKTKCSRPHFWASHASNSIFFKCQNRIENKREYDKNHN